MGFLSILVGFMLLLSSWAMGATPDTRWLSQTGVWFLAAGVIVEILMFLTKEEK